MVTVIRPPRSDRPSGQAIRAMGGIVHQGIRYDRPDSARVKQLEADDQYLPTDGGFLLGPWGLTMSLSRRDLVKMSVLAGAAVVMPLERSVSGASALANRIASSRLPSPFTTPFAMPKPLAAEKSSGAPSSVMAWKAVSVPAFAGFWM